MRPLTRRLPQDAPITERLEPRLLLEGSAIGPIPALIDPAMADQIVFAPGSSHRQIPDVDGPTSVLLAFALDGTGFSDVAQFDLAPAETGWGGDAALALYDANGNLRMTVDADPLVATPAIETMLAEIVSRQLYVLGIYFGPASMVDYDLTVTIGPQAANTAIAVDPATGVGQLQAGSPEDTFNTPADVDYYELDLLNAGASGTVTVTPTGLDVQAFATLFRRADAAEPWEPMDSGFDVNGAPVALSLTPPPGRSLTDGEYLLAVAPVGYNTAARSYDVSVAAAAPLGPAGVNPISVAEDFLTLPPSSWGLASASRTSTLTGGQQLLVQFRAPVTDTATVTLQTAAFQPVISVFDETGLDLIAVSSLTAPGTNTLELPVAAGEVYVVCVGDVGGDEQGEFTLTVSSPYSPAPLTLTGDVTTIGGVQIGASQTANFYRFQPAYGTDVLMLALEPDSPAAARVVLIGEDLPPVRQDVLAGQTLLLPVDLAGAYGQVDLYVAATSGDATATLRIGQLDVPFEIAPSVLAEGRLDLAGGLAAMQPAGAFGTIGGVRAYQFTMDPVAPPAVMAADGQASAAIPLVALYRANGNALRLVEYELPDASGLAEIHAYLPGRELLGLVGISLGFDGQGQIGYSWDAPDAVGVGVGMVPDQVPDPDKPPTPPFGAVLKIRDVVLRSEIEQHLWQTLIPYNIIPGLSFPIRLTPTSDDLTAKLTVYKPDGTVLDSVTNSPGQSGDIQLNLSPSTLEEMKGGAMLFRVEPVSGQPIGDGLYTLEMEIETTDPMPFLMTETAWTFYNTFPLIHPDDAGEVNMLPGGESVVDIVQNQFGDGWAEGEFTSSDPHDEGLFGNQGSIDVYRFLALTPGPISVRTVWIDENVNTNLKVYQARLSETGTVRYLAESTRVDPGLGDWFPADRSVIDDQTYINDFDALALGSQGPMYYVVVKNEQGTQGRYRIEVDVPSFPLLGGTDSDDYADALVAEAAYIPPHTGGAAEIDIAYVAEIAEFVGVFPVQVPDYHDGVLDFTSPWAYWNVDVFDADGQPLEGSVSHGAATTGTFALPEGPQTVYLRIGEIGENVIAWSTVTVSTDLVLPEGLAPAPAMLRYSPADMLPTTPMGDGSIDSAFTAAGQTRRFAFQAAAGPLTVDVTPQTTILDFEAEDFTRRVAGEDPDNPGVAQRWRIIDATAGAGLVGDGESPGAPRLEAKFAGASGDRYVQVLPDVANAYQASDGSQVDAGPAVEYEFTVPVGGRYNLQVRWGGHDGGSDSLFASIVELRDGIGSGQADWYRYAHGNLSDFDAAGYQGTAQFEGTSGGGGDIAADWDLEAEQTYTLRLTPREDGVAVDAFRLVLAPELALRWGVYEGGKLRAWDQTQLSGLTVGEGTTTTLILPELRPPLATPQYAWDQAAYHDVIVYVQAVNAPGESGAFTVEVDSAAELPMRDGELSIPPDTMFASAVMGFGEGIDGKDWLRLDVPYGVSGDVSLEVAMWGMDGGGTPMRYDLYDTDGGFVSSGTQSTDPPVLGKVTFGLAGVVAGASYYVRAGVVNDADNTLRLTASAVLPKANPDSFAVPPATRSLLEEKMRHQAIDPDGTLGGTVVQPFDGTHPGWLISEAFWVGTPGLATFSMELSDSVRPYLALYRGRAQYNPGENPKYSLELVDYVNGANVVNGNEYHLTAYVEPGMYALKAGRASGTGTPSYSLDIPDYVPQEIVLNPNSGSSTEQRHLAIDATRDGFGQYESNKFVAYRTTFFHVVTPAGSQAGVTALATTLIDNSLVPSSHIPAVHEEGTARIKIYRWDDFGGYFTGIVSGMNLDPPSTHTISTGFSPGLVYPFREFWVALNRDYLKEKHKIGVGFEFVVPQSGTPELIVDSLTLWPNSGQTLAKATVRNIGFASTSFFGSRFQYTDTSQNPAHLTTSDLPELPMGPLSSRHRSLDWKDPQRPEDEGTYIVDFLEGVPGGAIEELDETNNQSTKMLATVDPHRPTVSLALADPLMDGTSPSDGVWGRYISGVPGATTDVLITGQDVDGDLFRVTGHFPPFNPPPTVDYSVGQFLIAGMNGSQDSSNIVSYSFGNLRPTTQANPNIIHMTVKDEYGLPSDEASMAIHVEAFPGWLDDSESSLTFDEPNHRYVMAFRNTLIDVQGTIDSLTGVSVPFIGGLDNRILAEITADGTASLNPNEVVTASVTAHGQVTILGQDIINETYSGSVEPTDHFKISALLYVKKETLEAETLAVTFELIDLPLFNFESPEIVLFAYGVPGVASINANLQFLLDATLDAAVTIGIPMTPPIVPGLMSPSFVAPTVTAGLKIAGEIEILGFDIAELSGTIDFGITPAYGLSTPPSQLVPFQDFFDYSCLDVLGELGGEIAAEVLGFKVFSFDLPSATFDFSSGCTVVKPQDEGPEWTVTILGGSDLVGHIEGDPAPNLVIDPITAKAIYLQLVDADANPNITRNNLAFSQRQGSWGSLTVIPDAAHVSAPVLSLTHDDEDTPAVVVYQSLVVEGDPAGKTRNQFLTGQDIRSRYFNGSTWLAEQSLTSDALYDAEPVVAFNGMGRGVTAWVHNTYAVPLSEGGEFDRSANEIQVAAWDPATHAWTATQTLTSDAVADSKPAVFVDDDGTLYVVWLRDTLAGNEVMYSTNSGSGWSVPAALDIVGLPEEGKVGSVAIGSEGPRRIDVLLTHSRTFEDSSVESRLYNRPSTIAGFASPTALEIVAEDANFSHLRTVRAADDGALVAYWQQGDGVTNEIFASRIGPVPAGSSTWSAPIRLTSGDDLEFAPSVAVDTDGTYQVVYEKATAPVPAAPGEPPPSPADPAVGMPTAGEVGTSSVQLLPELGFSREMGFPNRSLAPSGTEAVATARIVNHGPAGDNVLIQYFEDSAATSGPEVVGSEEIFLAPGSEHEISHSFVAASGPATYSMKLTALGGGEVVGDGDNTSSAALEGLSDLAVESVVLSNDQPCGGDTVIVTSTIRNLSSEPIGAFDVELYQGDPAYTHVPVILLDTDPVGGLAPGASVEVVSSWVVPSDGGTFVLTSRADSAEAITEATEFNNDGHAVAIVRPDAAILEAPVATVLDYTGTDNVQVTAEIWNVGHVDLTGVSVQLLSMYNDGDLESVDVTTIGSLPAGTSTQVSWLADGLAGENRYRVVVDPAMEKPDSDSTNNLRETMVVLQGLPDLEVANAHLDTDSPAQNDAVCVLADVSNLGIDAAENVVVEVFATTAAKHHFIVGQTVLDAIDPLTGAVVTIAIDTSELVGEVEISVVADRLQQILEVTDYNNEDAFLATFETDTKPPQIAKPAVFNDGISLWSKVDSIAVQFSENVEVDPDCLILRDHMTGDEISMRPAEFRYFDETFTARWDVRDLGLDVGRYDVTLVGDLVMDMVGQGLDGDGDGRSGGDYETNFLITYPGDASLDGAVDHLDYIRLKRNIGKMSEAAWEDGNFNGDEDVDADRYDFVILRSFFGWTIKDRLGVGPAGSDVEEPATPAEGPTSSVAGQTDAPAGEERPVEIGRQRARGMAEEAGAIGPPAGGGPRLSARIAARAALRRGGWRARPATRPVADALAAPSARLSAGAVLVRMRRSEDAIEATGETPAAFLDAHGELLDILSLPKLLLPVSPA